MRKIALILLVSMLVMAVAACVEGPSTYQYDTHNFNEAMGDVTPTAAVSTVEIDWVAGSVRVVNGSVSAITVHESGVGEANNIHLYYRVYNDTMTIAFAADDTNVRNISKNLTVTVPQDKPLGTLRINSVAATVHVETTVTDLLDVSGVSARMECALPGVKRVKAETTSGGINLRLGVTRELELESVSGNVNVVVQKMFDELEAETVSGNVTVTMPADAAFDMHVTTVSGRVNAGDFACTIAGKHYKCGVDGAEMEIETTSGNVNLKKG